MVVCCEEGEKEEGKVSEFYTTIRVLGGSADANESKSENQIFKIKVVHFLNGPTPKVEVGVAPKQKQPAGQYAPKRTGKENIGLEIFNKHSSLFYHR